MRGMAAVLIAGVGGAVAVGAHLAMAWAERRARRAYEELVGEEEAARAPDDGWRGVRRLVGGWGCLVPALALVRGVGVAAAVGAGLYVVAGLVAGL